MIYKLRVHYSNDEALLRVGVLLTQYLGFNVLRVEQCKMIIKNNLQCDVHESFESAVVEKLLNLFRNNHILVEKITL